MIEIKRNATFCFKSIFLLIAVYQNVINKKSRLFLRDLWSWAESNRRPNK